MNFIKLAIVIAVVIVFSGCSTAWVKKIGNNRYQINAIGSLMGSPNDNFTSKAQEVCPNGYKVIERHGTNDLYGTIECD